MEGTTSGLSADSIEMLFWSEQPLVIWGGLAVLAAMLAVCALCLRRYRQVMHVHRELVRELRENEASFGYLLEIAHEGIVVVQNKRLVYLNPRMSEMTGYTEEELKALPTFMPLIDPSAREEMLTNHLRRLAGQPSPQRYESLFLRKDGTSYPIELSGVAITWKGQPATLNIVTDISKRKAAEEKMQYMAHHDNLTGLPNRYALQERLSQAIALAHRNQMLLAVLFIDLNGFKQVNDTYGHEVGDGLLQQVAKRLGALLRDSDILSRMGGDEFVILLSQVNDLDSVSNVVERIHSAMEAPFHVQEHRLSCCASLGVAFYPDDGASAEALLSRADHKMYAEKKRYHQRAVDACNADQASRAV